MSLPPQLSPPKLCCLVKWATYSGYGFNLHAEKGKPGQYIGKVDPNSPADLGGLQPKDFLVEVNGGNVEDLSHQKVVERIKETPDKVTMLVSPAETYKYCKEHTIVISSFMPEVVTFTTPDFQPGTDEMVQKDEMLPAFATTTEAAEPARPSSSHEAYDATDQVNHSEETAETHSSKPSRSESPEPQPPQPAVVAAPPTPPPAREPVPRPEPQPPSQHPAVADAASADAAAHNGGGGSSSKTAAAATGGGGGGGGNDPVGNISLEEMRAKLGRNKRTQVKLAPSTFSEKSNMFQAL